MKNYKIKTSFVVPDKGLSSKYRAEKFAQPFGSYLHLKIIGQNNFPCELA